MKFDPKNPLGMYTLSETRIPVPCPDHLQWAEFMETADRHVADDTVGPLRVSTVFLGLDHSFGGDPPILFETMIFGADEASDMHETYCKRYATWAEAEAGHHVAVKRAAELLTEARNRLAKSSSPVKPE